MCVTLMNKNGKITTCNRLDLETLGFWTTMLKILLEHGCGNFDHAKKGDGDDYIGHLKHRLSLSLSLSTLANSFRGYISEASTY